MGGWAAILNGKANPENSPPEEGVMYKWCNYHRNGAFRLMPPGRFQINFQMFKVLFLWHSSWHNFIFTMKTFSKNDSFHCRSEMRSRDGKWHFISRTLPLSQLFYSILRLLKLTDRNIQRFYRNGFSPSSGLICINSNKKPFSNWS